MSLADPNSRYYTRLWKITVNDFVDVVWTLVLENIFMSWQKIFIVHCSASFFKSVKCIRQNSDSNWFLYWILLRARRQEKQFETISTSEKNLKSQTEV